MTPTPRPPPSPKDSPQARLSPPVLHSRERDREWFEPFPPLHLTNVGPRWFTQSTFVGLNDRSKTVMQCNNDTHWPPKKLPVNSPTTTPIATPRGFVDFGNPSQNPVYFHQYTRDNDEMSSFYRFYVFCRAKITVFIVHVCVFYAKMLSKTSLGCILHFLDLCSKGGGMGECVWRRILHKLECNDVTSHSDLAHQNLSFLHL